MEILDGYSTAWVLGLLAALLVTGVVAGLMAGLLGVGGGIVIVPVLYHLFTLLGVDEAVRMHLAVGTSLATIIPTSIMSARAHHRRGSIDKSLLKRLMPGVIVGVIVGTVLSGYLSGQMLSAVFATVAMLVAVNMAFKKEGFAVADHLPGPAGTSTIGGVIGGISCLMGIGGGTLSVPTLNAFRVPIHVAVGTGAALGIVISIPGTLGFLVNGLDAPSLPPGSIGYVNFLGWAVIVPMTMLTSGWGAALAHAINARRLRQVFAVFLALTSARMFYGILA